MTMKPIVSNHLVDDGTTNYLVKRRNASYRVIVRYSLNNSDGANQRNQINQILEDADFFKLATTGTWEKPQSDLTGAIQCLKRF